MSKRIEYINAGLKLGLRPAEVLRMAPGDFYDLLTLHNGRKKKDD